MSDSKHSKVKEEKVNNELHGDDLAESPSGESSREEEPAEDDTKSKHKKKKQEKSADKTEELTARLADLSDRHLRLQAEFDNFRKRTLKEKADLIKSGGESVLTNILPILDDFERALAVLAGIPEEDPSKTGFLLIYSKFRDFLKFNNVTEIEAAGQDFDVDLHDAITKIPAPSEELKGKVVDVLQKGYLLNGRVIRYAKVIIGE